MYAPNISFPKAEEEVLKFWNSHDIFRTGQRLARRRARYVLYDGPPFATGLPHYGHILSGTVKDTMARFAHQQGFFVDRRFGWDCHGLPVEHKVDKVLKIVNRSQVLEMGIAAYNEVCRKTVLRYAGEWKRTVARMGRWADIDNAYRTMDSPFMETTWHIFKLLFERNLIYRGHRVMPFSTACKTPLSNFEANQNYKDVSDPSILVSFPLCEPIENVRAEMVCWTTTPWTLPSNLLLLVNVAFEYAIVEWKEQPKGAKRSAGAQSSEGSTRYLILHAERVPTYFPTARVVAVVRGSALIGRSYEPPFSFFSELRSKGFFTIRPADYVSSSSGTAVVHCAPAFGEDDYAACVASSLISENDPVPCPVDEDGSFVLEPYRGIYVKELDKRIIEDLGDRLLYSGKIVHSYPFCWRSDTPLIYRLVPNWFVRVADSRAQLLRNNEKIEWMPQEVKLRRLHNWLAGARDWAVGRNRFWGTPVPVWIAEDATVREEEDVRNSKRDKEERLAEDFICVGSVEELERLSGTKVSDLHREHIDGIVILRNGKVYRRTEEVLDCWFESGSMPYAQCHWPFSEPGRRLGKGVPDISFSKEGGMRRDVAPPGGSGTCGINAIKDKRDFSDSQSISHSVDRIDLGKSCDSEDKMIIRSTEDNSRNVHGGAEDISAVCQPLTPPREFPADFIAEGIDQTRGWFYTLHTLSTLLFDRPAFSRVLVFGVVLAEDGRKMSKRLRNYPDPQAVFDKHGADSLRLYLLSSPVVAGENLRFSEAGVAAVTKTILIPCYNTLSFFLESPSVVEISSDQLCPSLSAATPSSSSLGALASSAGHPLDAWILTTLMNLVRSLKDAASQMRLAAVTSLIARFVDDLSNWYVRISRKRIRAGEGVLGRVLLEFATALAPFAPFFSEYLYQSLRSRIRVRDRGESGRYEDHHHLTVSDSGSAVLQRTKSYDDNSSSSQRTGVSGCDHELVVQDSDSGCSSSYSSGSETNGSTQATDNSSKSEYKAVDGKAVDDDRECDDVPLSVHFRIWPAAEKRQHPFEEAKTLIECIRQLREKNKIRLRRPLKTCTIVGSAAKIIMLKQFDEIIREECNLLSTVYATKGDGTYMFETRVRPYFDVIRRNSGGDRETMKAKVELIRRMTGAELEAKLWKEDEKEESSSDTAEDDSRAVIMKEENGVVVLKEEMLIERRLVGAEEKRTDNGKTVFGAVGGLGVVLDVTEDQHIKDCTAAREFYSFVQKMRKAAKLQAQDRVAVEVFGRDAEYLKGVVAGAYPGFLFGSTGEAVAEAEFAECDLSCGVKLYRQ